MPLDQHIRKPGTPLYDLLKEMDLSSTWKQSSGVRTNSQAVRASNVDSFEPSGQVPPPSLPVELWSKIIHELGHEEWVALCRVCWLLYQIAQPCLYENIILRPRENRRREIFSGPIGDLPQFKRISSGRIGDPPQFKRTIDQRPELGEHVRSLALYMNDRPGPNHRECYPLLFELYLFPHLERLQVSHIHFDLELCNILHSHPRLKSVTVTSCTLDESLAIAGINGDCFPHSSISTVEVLYPMHNSLIHGWASLASAKLESLAVRSTLVASDVGLILASIRELNKTSYLTTLSLDRFSPAVVRFLIASPQLRHLILDSWLDEYDLMSSLPTDAIPFLEEYSGPLDIASTLIRGRPVHTVKFIFPRYIPEDRLVEIFISLQYSAVPLTSLGLYLRNAILGSWLFHIPVTVHYLAVEYVDWLEFEKWLPALSHLTSLHTFSGTFMSILQGEGVMKISDTCQSLQEIDDGSHRWVIGGQRVWGPFTLSATY